MRKTVLAIGALVMCVARPPMAGAQDGPPVGGTFLLDGLYASQSDTDLDDGGSFSASRTFLRGGGFTRFENGLSAGAVVSLGEFDYDFSSDTPAPWDTIKDLSVSVPLRFQGPEGPSYLFVPSLRYDYESGADRSDGMTYGFFAGASWRISDNLRIGPAFGAFSELESGGLDLFPALLVDWDITDRLNLSTGAGLGATQGPGLNLTYAANDRLRFGLAGRVERVRFRLDDDGVASGGVGEDSSYPVVVTVEYEPFPGGEISAFAGMEFGGELRLEDDKGKLIDRQDYDPAPVFGAAFRFRF